MPRAGLVVEAEANTEDAAVDVVADVAVSVEVAADVVEPDIVEEGVRGLTMGGLIVGL